MFVFPPPPIPGNSAGLTINKTYVFFNSFFRLFSKKFLAEIRDFLILIFKFCNYVENVRFVHNVTDGYFGVERGLKMNKNAIFLSKFKKIVLFFGVICCFGAKATTINIDWKNTDGTNYAQTTCETGGNLTLPTAPTKYGHTFAGWKLSKYTPIEYIESTGTQYINTDINVSNTSKIIISLQILQQYANSDQKLFGTGNKFYMATLDGYYRGTNVPVSTTQTQITIVADTNSKQATFVHDNITDNKTSWWVIAETGAGFPIFGAMHSNIFFARYKCFYFKQYDLNNALVRDMIPVLDDNNVACMYDRVSKECFYNSGTGEFIAGPAK